MLNLWLLPSTTSTHSSYSVYPVLARLSAVPAGPPPVPGHATRQPVCGRILLYVQPAGLLQPAGELAQPYQRAQHCNLELRVSIHANITFVIKLQPRLILKG